ncbi:MAG TPA: OsmC family protein [Phenylobacterium sp.]|nr:OsmC family protein [Phenylobacterium sp.]
MARARADIGAKNFEVAITAGHHQLTADERPDLGGQDAGPAPYEILCAALCACTSITLRMYAVRKGWPLEALHVDVLYTLDDKGGAIARRLQLSGPLDEAQRARLADIAERTPVTLTLKRSLPIVTTLEDAVAAR